MSLTLPILFLYVDSAFNQTFNFHAFPFTLLALAALKETIKYLKESFQSFFSAEPTFFMIISLCIDTKLAVNLDYMECFFKSFTYSAATLL